MGESQNKYIFEIFQVPYKDFLKSLEGQKNAKAKYLSYKFK